MAKKRESGQTASARRWLVATSLALGVTLFSGCSQTPVASGPQQGDPLHGVLTPPGMPQPNTRTEGVGGLEPGAEPAVRRCRFVRDQQRDAGQHDVAGHSPLGKPLALDDSNKTPTPGQLTTGGKAQTPVPPGYVAPNANPKVQPIPDAKPANPPLGSWQPVNPQPTVQTVGASSAPTVSNGVLDKQLQDRGVINQKLDQVPGGVVLTCYVARPGGGFRILSNKTPTADYASAAQAILQQLDTTPKQP